MSGTQKRERKKPCVVVECLERSMLDYGLWVCSRVNDDICELSQLEAWIGAIRTLLCLMWYGERCVVALLVMTSHLIYSFYATSTSITAATKY